MPLVGNSAYLKVRKEWVEPPELLTEIRVSEKEQNPNRWLRRYARKLHNRMKIYLFKSTDYVNKHIHTLLLIFTKYYSIRTRNRIKYYNKTNKSERVSLNKYSFLNLCRCFWLYFYLLLYSEQTLGTIVRAALYYDINKKNKNKNE